MSLDDIDKKIVTILQQDGRITNARLAKLVGISPAGMLDRVRRLEKNGTIRKYVALVNPEHVGRGTLAFVSVTLAMHRLPSIDSFIEEIAAMPEVLESYHVTGEEDFILKVAVGTISEYEDFLLHKLTRIEGVGKVKTTIVLSTTKYETGLGVNGGSETVAKQKTRMRAKDERE